MEYGHTRVDRFDRQRIYDKKSHDRFTRPPETYPRADRDSRPPDRYARPERSERRPDRYASRPDSSDRMLDLQDSAAKFEKGRIQVSILS